MIGMNDLYYAENSTDDLIQMGKTTYWVTELSSSNKETFVEFQSRIYSHNINYDMQKNQLSYTSEDKELILTYNQDFIVNGEQINTEYSRFDSTYSNVERKADTIVIEDNDKELHLDFYNLSRIVID
jgi:hypothetical protein